MELDRQRLQAYRYVTGEEAASYLAVMRVEALAEDPHAGAGEVTALFAVFEGLVTSTRDFYARVGEVLARAEVDREALAGYREVLLDYLQRLVDEEGHSALRACA